MHKITRRVLTAALTSISISSAFAALPQSGLWSINGESSGKPARSVQIERQGGNTVVVSYLGFRADGSAMYLQAAGEIEDGKTFVGNLTEFKNGTALGGAVRNAEVARVVGQIRIQFDTSSAGSITLPGEKKQPFSRYIYDDHRNRLNNKFLVTTVATSGAGEFTAPSTMQFEINGNQLTARTRSGENFCKYSGTLTPSGSGFKSAGSVSCGRSASSKPAFYRFEDLKVDDSGVLSMRYLSYWDANASSTLNMNDGGTLFGICILDNEGSVADPTPQRCTPEQMETGKLQRSSKPKSGTGGN